MQVLKSPAMIQFCVRSWLSLYSRVIRRMAPRRYIENGFWLVFTPTPTLHELKLQILITSKRYRTILN